MQNMCQTLPKIKKSLLFLLLFVLGASSSFDVMGQCSPGSYNSTYEYIDQIQFYTITNVSGNNSGYGNFSGQSTTVVAGSYYNLTMTPGFPSTTYNESWSAFIDWNNNGVLNDAGEMVATGTTTGTTPLTVSVGVPAGAVLNTNLRMRVIMVYGSAQTDPCGSATYGEVEDYSVMVTSGNTCNNVTSAGTIGYDETQCMASGYTPTNIYNVTSPSGGSGNLEYVWLSSYDAGNTYTVISGANLDWYQPPFITQTTWYRRCARRAGCTDFVGESNWVKKEIYCSQTCDNVTAAGTIGYDETVCAASFDPAVIQNVTSPSGGTGTLEYVWLISYDGGTNSTSIANSNSATYDPGVITQTTWYRRCARRAGCTSYVGESNWVKKEINCSQSCTATVNGFQFKDPTGASSSVVSITNGGTYNIANLPNPFNVEALLTGNMESVRFTVTGAGSGSNVENAYAWDYAGSGSTWPHGAGTFTMLVEAFPQDNALGTICASQSFTFTITSPCTTCPNNIVLNPSFESGTSNWSWSGGNLYAGGGAVYCGSSSGDFEITNPSSNWASQTIGSGTLLPGGILNVSVYAGTHDNSYYHEVGLNYFTSSWGWISNTVVEVNKVLSQSPAGPQLYNLTSTIPANAYYVNVVFNGTGSWIKTDNWCVTYTPPVTCSNVTSGGTIGYDESVCGNSMDPALIQNVTAPSGGSGTLEYVWLISYDGGATNTTIANSNSETYDPGVITQTTWYRRCARRSGCTSYVGESNWIKKELTFCAPAMTCPSGNFNWTQTIDPATGNPSIVKLVSGSTNTYTISTGFPASMTTGPVVLAVTNVMSYDGYATRNTVTQTNERWRLLFKKSGSTIYTTPYTDDLADLVRQANWSGALGTSFTAPNGIDEIVIEHYDVANGSGGPGSVIPTGICVSIQNCPTANAGSPATLTCTTPSAVIGTTTTSGYTYSWSPSTGLSSTSISNPTVNATATTTYTVTVGNGTGCTATSAVTVTVNKTPPTANAGGPVTLTCTTPSATIGTTTTSGYTYSWSPATGLSSTTISNPTVNITATATYTVTVTGSNGCTATSAVTVTVNKTPPSADAGVDKTTTCTTPSAMIGTAAVSGNTYSWSPATGLSSTTVAQPTANPSATTTYTVTVTGANGCTSADAVVVTVNKTPPTANAGGPVTLTCTTPSATIGTTTTSGYTYSWSPATGLSSTTISNPTVNITATATYTVTVTGSNGCTATSAVTVTVNKTPPPADAGQDYNLTCSSPSVQIGTPGVVGNSYSWSPATGLSSATVAQPTANPSVSTTYTVTVTNAANGCTNMDVTVINVNKTPPTANAGSNVTLSCTTPSATIGTTTTSGYTYSWSPAIGLNSTTISNPTVSATTNTIYTVTVTGSNGCTATSTVSVNVDKNPPTANAGGAVTLSCTTPSATIGTTTTSGYTYSWSPATGLSSTTVSNPTVNITATATYTVTVTGSNGCTATSAVTVTVNKTPPSADAGVDKTTTCTTPSAMIGTAAVSGNTYSWSPATGLSSTTVAQPTANPSATTTYTVTVTGANGCTSADAVVVTVNKTPPTANAGGPVTLTCTTPSATIGTTTTAGYTYSWSPATGLSSTTISNPTVNITATATYTVTVTGSNGCTATSAVTVTVNKTPPTADAGPDKLINCANTSAMIGTQGIVGNSYSWSPSTGLNSTTVPQPTATPSATTTYTVTVTNAASGCTATDVVVVTVDNGLPTANAGVDKTLTCTTTSTQIGTTSISGYSYSWAPATGLNATNIAQPTAQPTTATAYTVTVTNSNGCTATDVVLVSINQTPPTADAGSNKTVCSTTNATIGTAAISGNTYLWSNGVTTAIQTVNPSATTSYTVTVTGSNGCTATDVVTVNFREGSVGNYVWMDVNADGINNEASSNGINGITVQLYSLGGDNQQGTSDDVLEATTVTANSGLNPGYYEFKICNTNNYYVKFPSNAGALTALTNQTTTTATDNNSDANVNTGMSPVFNINVNGTGVAKDNSTIDAGYYPQMSTGNLVWNDINKNGVKDANENGIANATVYLYNDANNDNVPDGAAIANTTTNTTGNYIFNGLKPGNYIIGVVPPTPASGAAYTSTPVNETDPDTDGDNNDNGVNTTSGQTFSNAITLAAGTEPTGETPNNGTAPDQNSNLTVDFGFYQAVNINGNVYVDNNGPENVDGTPTGTAGTTPLYANLTNPNGIVIAVVPVNSNGTFQFLDVQPNTTYNVVLTTTPGTPGNSVPNTTLPTGWNNVSEDCCDNTGNDGTTNGTTTVTVANTDVFNANFGITQPLSLGNMVWNDINKNGVKDANENGIANATVNVYSDANLDGSPDGIAIQTTTTNSNGNYVFNNLRPGSYVVGVVPPAPASGPGYASTPVNESNPNSDGDNNDNGINTTAGQTFSGTVTLAIGTEPAGELPNNGSAPDLNSNLTVDFGFYQAINITGNVYVDNNGPTNVDGTPTGSAGSTPLYANLIDPVTGNVISSVQVNPNGTYQFNDVQPNTNYCMVLSPIQGVAGSPAPSTTLPNGWSNVSEDCCDNTGNDGTTNGSTCFSVATTNVDNVNFGIREKLALGNMVWNDTNKDGIKDPNESGIGNATVYLYNDANTDCSADGAAIRTTFTDANGLYIFEDLASGSYIVGVVPPTVTGGVYTSSAAGEENNPNANGDNNDNGTVAVGNEIRSCTVTLAGGTEPTGELPNNTTTVDNNANLTVDFGFFLCPTNFTFTPTDVCAGTTLDLTTLEPVGYTGGVWSQNGQPITNTNVANGTYVYTYTNGTCTASGTQVLNIKIPDYAPIIAITPSVVYGNKPVRVIVTINELLGKTSCKPVYVFIPRLEPRYTFVWDPTATQFGAGGAGTVNNAEWQYITSNPNFYIWKYIANGTIFPANGQSKFGYVGSYDPNNTDGATTFSVQIFQGSGGETNLLNNTDSELLIYYRQ